VAAIIFDFDGTIANTIDYFIDFLAVESKIPRPNGMERQKYYDKSLVRIARLMGQPWWKMGMLYYRGRRHMEPHIEKYHTFDDMPELIEKLHAEGHELFIISSNSTRNVRVFLRHHKLNEFFLQIYGGIIFFGKAPALRKLLKDQNLDLKQAVYIGDELRDVQAAKSVGMRVIAVGWGFASHADLRHERPSGFADNPSELMSILETI
jgi:phosphoglycolate phosphatase-like HAD superfamily hydrolase